MNIHLYGFAYTLINTIYAFAEEFGWRKYLQNALEGLNENAKYILIGVVWWIWHFRFDTQFDFYIFPLICIGGGFFLGKLVDATKSILPVVSMHTLIILTTNSGILDKNKIIGRWHRHFYWWETSPHPTRAGMGTFWNNLPCGPDIFQLKTAGRQPALFVPGIR